MVDIFGLSFGSGSSLAFLALVWLNLYLLSDGLFLRTKLKAKTLFLPDYRDKIYKNIIYRYFHRKESQKIRFIPQNK